MTTGARATCSAAAPLIVLDIGWTIVDGATEGPADLIAHALELDDRQRSALDGLLMTRSLCGPADVAALLRADFGLTGHLVDDVATEVWTTQEDAATPLPGAAAAIADLASHGCRFAVTSNIWQPYLTSVRKHFGGFLDQRVPASWQMFSFREGCAKPSPELLRRTLEASAVTPGEAIVVGDSYTNDMAPAMSRGTRTIWLLHRIHQERKSLIRVLNAEVSAPSLALESIAHLDWRTVSSVLASPPSAQEI